MDKEQPNWTIAWRNVGEPVFRRVTDWSGTWVEAYAMAEIVGVTAQDGTKRQIWYVVTRQAELANIVRLAAEQSITLELHLPDIGNILVDRPEGYNEDEEGNDGDLVDGTYRVPMLDNSLLVDVLGHWLSNSDKAVIANIAANWGKNAI